MMHRRKDVWTEDDFEWMIEFLPVQALRDILVADDHDNRRIMWWEPEYAMALERNPQNTSLRMSLLIDFLAVSDPFNESAAYKLLEECDPGLKKLKAVTILANRIAEKLFIFPLDEWKKPKFLTRWVVLNVVPKLNQIPEAVAERAYYVLRDTNYMQLWSMVFMENKSLEKVRRRRYLDKAQEKRLKAKADRKAEARWKAAAKAAAEAEKKEAKSKGDQSKWSRFLCKS